MDIFTFLLMLVGFTAGYFSRQRQDEKDEAKAKSLSKYDSYFKQVDKLNAIKQKSEDDKVYRNYHSQRTQEMYEAHINNFFKTINAIDEHHATLQRPKEEDFVDLDRRYKQYEYECNKLKVSPHILTYEQFAIQQSNMLFCKTIRIANPMPIMYTIYDIDTAKYKHGNIEQMCEYEFQTKFYADLK